MGKEIGMGGKTFGRKSMEKRSQPAKKCQKMSKNVKSSTAP